MKILVAEDDAVSRRLLCTTLKHLGYETLAFENGLDAFEAHCKSPFSIIVSDWVMPVMDGLELCRKVRGQGLSNYSYFILLTAQVRDKQAYREAMEAGIDDFLTKPLDKDQIWMRLRVAERILKYASHIHHLEQLLPICSYCKKVRDDNNYWQQVESYIAERTGTFFSHSICPECFDKVITPQMEEMRRAQGGG